MSDLTDKQEQFCLEYVVDYNATQAALRSGYSENSAYSIGWENLRKPEIAARVKELSNATADELGLTRRRILLKLWENAQKDNPGASNKALELLMKHRGDLIDRIQHEGGIEITVNGVSLDDLR